MPGPRRHSKQLRGLWGRHSLAVAASYPHWYRWILYLMFGVCCRINGKCADWMRSLIARLNGASRCCVYWLRSQLVPTNPIKQHRQRKSSFASWYDVVAFLVLYTHQWINCSKYKCIRIIILPGCLVLQASPHLLAAYQRVLAMWRLLLLHHHSILR